MSAEFATIEIDGLGYRLEIHRRRSSSARAPQVSIVMVSYNAAELTRVAIESVRANVVGDYELWVVDNASSDDSPAYLAAQRDVNVILNRTLPRQRPLLGTRRFGLPRRGGQGSYANGIAVELGVRYVSGRYMVVLHNDILISDPNWLPLMLSKVGEQVRAVGMMADPKRIHAMVLNGFLFDLSLFRELNMTFLPQLPKYDGGDLVTEAIRRRGLSYYVCANTFNRPETVNWIRDDDPFKRFQCDRVFDDNRRIIFAHLGRGTMKVAGLYTKPGKTSHLQWVEFAERFVLPRREVVS